MKYGFFEGLEKPVSRIILGTSTKAFSEGRQSSALLDEAVLRGITAIDTARVYKNAEKSIGAWLRSRGEMRDRIVIISKCGHPDIFGIKRVNGRAMCRDLKKSLDALQTDYIDVYLLHRDDVRVPAGEIVEIFNDMKARGSIKLFGVSNWTADRIAQANEYAYSRNLCGISLSSPYFGLAEQYGDPWRGGVSIAGKRGERDRLWYERTGMPVVAYSALARGVLSGKIDSGNFKGAAKQFDRITFKSYVSADNFEKLRRCEHLARVHGTTVAAVALSYIMSGAMNVFPVVSCSGARRLEQNIAATELVLSDEEVKWLELKTARLK